METSIISKDIQRAVEQLDKLVMFSRIYTCEQCKDGQEHRVSYDINEIIRRHTFYAKRVYYHAKNYLTHFDKLTLAISSAFTEGTMGIDSDALSYDFDAFLAAIGAFTEAQFYEDGFKFLSKNLSEELNALRPSKKDPESFYWRVNILRNRTVHPDNPLFNDIGDRYREFNSQIMGPKLSSGRIVELPVHLIDTKLSPVAVEILKTEVIGKSLTIQAEYKAEKKEGKHSNCRPVLPDFFSTITQMGSKSDTPFLLISSPIDLNTVFVSVLSEITHLLSAINLIYEKEIKILYSILSPTPSIDLDSVRLYPDGQNA